MPAADRAVLEGAFARDGELRTDAGLMLGGLVDLGLGEAFVQLFVRRLRRLGAGEPPAGAVLPALEETLAVAERRGDQRAIEEVRRWLR